MQVSDIMRTDVKTIGEDDSIAAASRKMREANVGCLVVTNARNVVGVITDRDMVIDCLTEAHDPWGCLVYQHMSKPAIVVKPTADILDAAQMMAQRKIRRLPVMDGSKLVGIVSFSDVALAMDRAMHDLLVGMSAAKIA
jgi:CBS domain-containing protein